MSKKTIDIFARKEKSITFAAELIIAILIITKRRK